jgi:hypothetical protein
MNRLVRDFIRVSRALCESDEKGWSEELKRALGFFGGEKNAKKTGLEKKFIDQITKLFAQLDEDQFGEGKEDEGEDGGVKRGRYDDEEEKEMSVRPAASPSLSLSPSLHHHLHRRHRSSSSSSAYSRPSFYPASVSKPKQRGRTVPQQALAV